MEVYETSAAGGNSLSRIVDFKTEKTPIIISLNPEEKFQTITGFGGSFTESSASLLNRLSKGNRKKILEAYFGKDGANYSLTRTHINSCDFSLDHYAYAMVDGDKKLESFSIAEDKEDIIPMILEANYYRNTMILGHSIIQSTSMRIKKKASIFGASR
jgi:glucosylceramidase